MRIRVTDKQLRRWAQLISEKLDDGDRIIVDQGPSRAPRPRVYRIYYASADPNAHLHPMRAVGAHRLIGGPLRAREAMAFLQGFDECLFCGHDEMEGSE